MKAQRLFAIILAYLSFTPYVFGMDYFKKTLSFKESSCSYIIIQDNIDIQRIGRMLGKNTIRPKRQIELANLCLNYPAECSGKNLFQKISPNLLLADGKSFVLTLFSRRQSNQYYHLLLREAFTITTLDPHLRNGTDESDLALEILKTDDKALISELLNHSQFNPNSRYGESLHPLATLLFHDKSFYALFMVMRQKNFHSNIADKNNNRPGYFMLVNSSPLDRDCFLAFMPRDLAAWNMRGLGLDLPQHLDTLLRHVLQNNDDRLLIFKKFVEQLMLKHEDFIHNIDFFNPLHTLFSLSKPYGSVNYINKEFTYKALKLLINYQTIVEKIEKGVHPCAYWYSKTKADLGEINIASVRAARFNHLEVNNNNNTCTLCLEGIKGDWFKTTKWCDHAFCADCLLDYASSFKADQEMLCPSRGCIFLMPPSLLLALSTTYPNSDNEFAKLRKVHENCQALQLKISEETLEAIPGFRRCPSCKRELVLNIKKDHTRTIDCPHCQKKFVITKGEGKDLVAFSAFTNLGQCNICNTPIDKIDGCENIICSVCKTGTIWVPLKQE